MKKKYYYNNPVVVFGWSPREGDESFEWSYTKFSDGTSPEENKEYPLSEVWDKDLVFDGIHRDNVGGTSEIEVHYLDKTALYQEGKFVAYIGDAFKTTNPFKLANGHTEQDQEGNETHYQFDKTKVISLEEIVVQAHLKLSSYIRMRQTRTAIQKSGLLKQENLSQRRSKVKLE